MSSPILKIGSSGNQPIQTGQVSERISPLLHPQLLAVLVKLNQINDSGMSKINPQIQKRKSSFTADLQCG